MRLSAPKFITFLLSTVIFALGIVSQFFTTLPYVSGNEMWFFIVGYALLWIGTLMKGF